MNEGSRLVIDEVIEEQGIVYVGEKRVITHAPLRAKSVVAIVDMMKLLVRGSSPLFSVSTVYGREELTETSLGAEFRRCLGVDTDAIRRHFHSHRFSPLYELFERYQNDCYALAFRPSAACVEPLNMLVTTIREEAKRCKLKAELDKDYKARHRNRLKLEAEFSRIRKQFRRILVVRVDLGYRSKLGGSGVVGGQVPYAEVRKNRRNFLSYLKGKDFEGKLLWYAWKQESGFEKGPHTHLLAVFDGREVRNDVALGFLLCRYWTEVVTGGEGAAFNCNHHKERRYREVGIGRLKRDDERGYKALYDHVIMYLTKMDAYFRFEVPGNARAFATSKLKLPDDP